MVDKFIKVVKVNTMFDEYYADGSNEKQEEVHFVYDTPNNRELIKKAQECIEKYKRGEELEPTVELCINGITYWEGDISEVDDDLLLDVCDMAGDETGEIYDKDEVEIIKNEGCCDYGERINEYLWQLDRPEYNVEIVNW